MDDDDLKKWRSAVSPLVRVLRRTHDEAERLGTRYGWSPWRASAAHADLHDPVWSSRNGHESQFVELASISWTRLLATLDLIGSLAHLLDSHVSPFGPFPVARAAVEASGRTAWLAETELSARDRVGRALADRCESLGFQWTAASAVEAELEAGALHERFSERVRFWGHEPIVTTEGRVTGIRVTRIRPSTKRLP